MSPVLENLPAQVRPFAESYLHRWPFEFEPPRDDVVAEIAWSNWARAKSNEDLAGVLLWVRKNLTDSGHNILSDQLEMAAMRLLHPKKFRQRVRGK